MDIDACVYLVVDVIEWKGVVGLSDCLAFNWICLSVCIVNGVSFVFFISGFKPRFGDDGVLLRPCLNSIDVLQIGSCSWQIALLRGTSCLATVISSSTPPTTAKDSPNFQVTQLYNVNLFFPPRVKINYKHKRRDEFRIAKRRDFFSLLLCFLGKIQKGNGAINFQLTSQQHQSHNIVCWCVCIKVLYLARSHQPKP